MPGASQALSIWTAIKFIYKLNIPSKQGESAA